MKKVSAEEDIRQQSFVRKGTIFGAVVALIAIVLSYLCYELRFFVWSSWELMQCQFLNASHVLQFFRHMDSTDRFLLNSFITFLLYALFGALYASYLHSRLFRQIKERKGWFNGMLFYGDYLLFFGTILLVSVARNMDPSEARNVFIFLFQESSTFMFFVLFIFGFIPLAISSYVMKKDKGIAKGMALSAVAVSLILALLFLLI